MDVGLEWEEEEMKILQSSNAPRVRYTLKLSCFVDLDQASTVYQKKKISEVSDIPRKIIES